MVDRDELIGAPWAKPASSTPTPTPAVENQDTSSIPVCTSAYASTSSWPEPASEDAFHGLAGDFVRIVEPVSEADPIALLTQYLTAFGNVIGREPHFVAEADRHAANLYIALVGQSAKARKGSSWGQVRRILEMVDPTWVKARILSGLSSGEGLIHAVRDPAGAGSQTKVGEGVDQGVVDKRTLVLEPELASVLRTIARTGNTLSAVIRNAWDSGDLQTLTRTNPLLARGAHVSLIGHITKEELQRYLDRTEMGNGFGNRFLYLCVKRSKSLPEGGQVSVEKIRGIAERTSDRVRQARSFSRMDRDSAARELWFEVYERLSEGKPGMLGALTARGEAQVMRLALIYALLDGSYSIGDVHLRAALGLWRYSEASCRFIFGDALGDPLADEILSALRKADDGMTRTEIRDLLGRHVPRAVVEGSLRVLRDGGLALQTHEPSGGRPTERWRAVR